MRKGVKKRDSEMNLNLEMRTTDCTKHTDKDGLMIKVQITQQIVWERDLGLIDMTTNGFALPKCR